MTALLLRSVSGQQRLDNVNQTHLVPASGRPVLKKGSLTMYRWDKIFFLYVNKADFYGTQLNLLLKVAKLRLLVFSMNSPSTPI